MDLSEIRGSQVRHPWETARATAIEHILRRASAQPTAVLDYGCGDGFTGERVLAAFGASRLVGVDIYLTDEQCVTHSNDRVHYFNDWSKADAGPFDLCLLCDVIEHVADDQALLLQVSERLAANGQALITVPAFQSLFTNHDRALKHFRRYTLSQLERVVATSGFELENSGYMFGSLLPGRGVSKLLEMLKPKADTDDFGIGAWKGSKTLTRTVETVLNIDNSVLLGLSTLGIKVPGLSAWALCKKR